MERNLVHRSSMDEPLKKFLPFGQGKDSLANDWACVHMLPMTAHASYFSDVCYKKHTI